jgi:hydrogenase maturation protease
VLILGVGSPAGDDQAGWLVVDALRPLLADARQNVVIEKLDRPGAALVPLLEGAERVILVDAMQGGYAPGHIQHFGREDWPAYRGGLSSHGLGVLDALALARAVGHLPEQIELYGIEIGCADPLASPGTAVRAAAARLAGEIAEQLKAVVL